MPEDIRRQVEKAYRELATKARYRPGAVSDGFGGLAQGPEWLNLNQELRDYADRFWEEEQADSYHIGLPNYPTRTAMVYALETARLCCSGSDALPYAIAVAKLAVEELERVAKEHPTTD